MTHATGVRRRVRWPAAPFGRLDLPSGEFTAEPDSLSTIFRPYPNGVAMHRHSVREGVGQYHRRWIARLALSVLVPLLGAGAQHGGGSSPNTQPPREASQYAFLIGQWDVTVTPKATTLATRIHGMPKLRGTWKAWRALEGFGVEDELRVVDAAGNPQLLTHFVRVYDGTARVWKVSAVDVYRATMTMSTAQWQGTEMRSTSTGMDADGKPYLTRTTLMAITPTSFRSKQDRSTDNGRTWTENYLVIDAKRTAAVAPR
ncbi:MAG TPA: hypothetical protein VE869_09810 [Gemmatimonas sp.]|nr:hypothetical protein [Gemmatimonas sp.]